MTLEATCKWKSEVYCADDMGKQEMLQIIESQKKEISYLQEKVKYLENKQD
jgi:hypothetical protein